MEAEPADRTPFIDLDSAEHHVHYAPAEDHVHYASVHLSDIFIGCSQDSNLVPSSARLSACPEILPEVQTHPGLQREHLMQCACCTPIVTRVVREMLWVWFTAGVKAWSM